ncbi:MAG: energy-coupling factor ABC transporter permease [Rhodospirillaceae bacterium]|nr:energy-coupling factor ABC transporter permease [Ideonella sp.]
MLLDLFVVMAALGVAATMSPWRALRSPRTQHPWLACLALLPWLWACAPVLPFGTALQLSGACLLVLMFGWPLAVLTLVPVAALGAWLGGGDQTQALAQLAWSGIVPATLALGLGVATRRWLPHNVFVFILGRGFFATLLAALAGGALAALWQPLPQGTDLATLLVGHGLIAWGEAFTTGLLTAVFVAFRPQWLATWSDRRYLHGGE